MKTNISFLSGASLKALQGPQGVIRAYFENQWFRRKPDLTFICRRTLQHNLYWPLSFCPGSICTAKPKSVSLIFIWSSRRMFSGFRSRWTMFWLWRYWTTSRRARMIFLKPTRTTTQTDVQSFVHIFLFQSNVTRQPLTWFPSHSELLSLWGSQKVLPSSSWGRERWNLDELLLAWPIRCEFQLYLIRLTDQKPGRRRLWTHNSLWAELERRDTPEVSYRFYEDMMYTTDPRAG